jgi:hypothetical protein
MKLIPEQRIDICNDCPHYMEPFHARYICDKACRKIPYEYVRGYTGIPIPDWCPLEDVKR